MRATFSELWSRSRLSLRDLGRLVGRSVLSLTLGLGVASIVASLLTREQYGTYRYVIDIAAALAFLSLPGLNQVVMQDTAKGLDGTLSRAWRRRLSASLIWTFVLMGLAVYYYSTERHLLARAFAAAAPLFPVKTALDAYRFYLLGRREFRLYTSIPLAIQIVVSAGTVLTAFLTRDPVVMLVVFGVLETLLHVAAFRYVLRRLPPRNVEFSASGLRFGVGLSAANITASLSAQLDTILVAAMFAMPEVALLSLAMLPVRYSRLLLNSLGEFFGPRVVSESGPRLFRRANRVILITVSVALAYVVIASTLMPVFFRTFFRDYPDAIPLAILAMLLLLVGVPITVMEQTLFAQERLAQTTMLRLLQFLFDLAVMVVLVQRFGVLGAVVGRIVAALFRLGMISIVYFRNCREAG